MGPAHDDSPRPPHLSQQSTRYEEDQIFLEESSSNQNREQQELLKKINRITPAVRIVTVCTGVMTAAILGFYVWDAVKQFNM